MDLKHYSFAPSCGIYEETGTFLYLVAEMLSADKGEHDYHESSKEISSFFNSCVCAEHAQTHNLENFPVLAEVIE